MKVTINHKPLMVEEDNEKEKGFSPIYLGVSCTGYLVSFWLLDYIWYIFFHSHPFPFISSFFHLLVVVAHWIGWVVWPWFL